MKKIMNFFMPDKVTHAEYDEKTSILTLIYWKKGIIKYTGSVTQWYVLPQFEKVNNYDEIQLLLRFYDLCKFRKKINL